MSLIKKLAGETALYGLSSIVGRFLNFLLVPLYTNTLAPSEYGVVSQFYSYTGFLMVIYSYRMESAFFRFGTPVEDRDRAYSTGFYSILVSTALLSALFFLFSQPIANLLQYPQHPEYVRFFGLILAFDCLMELPFARLRLEQKPMKFVFARLFNIGVYISLNLFWLLFCPWAAAKGHSWVNMVWSPSFGVGYIFLSNVIASGLTLLVLGSMSKDIFKAKFDPGLWKKMILYAAPLIIVGFAGIANEMLDRAMMPYLLTGSWEENQSQTGIYAANYKLAMLISLFTQAYRYAAEPFFFKNAQNKDALQTQANATKWFSIAVSLGMLAILLFQDVVQYFIGKNYREGLHVVPILLLSNVLLGIYYNVSVWYRLKDKTAVGAWISIAGAAITVILNYLWVPRFGYVGAAWATLVCYAFMTLACWVIGQKHYPVPYQALRIGFYLLLALGIYGLSLFIQKAMPLPLVGKLALNTVLFMVFPAVAYLLEKNNFVGKR